MKFLINSLILAILLIFTACSGGSGSSDNSSSGVDTSPQVVKVVIAPQSVLFTDLDQSKMLSATAYDASGNVINKSITWTTSHNDVVTIGADGNASAQGVIGSTTITAEAGGIKSAPIMITVAEVVGGAILVDDDQVIGNIELVAPTVPPGVGSQYKVTLKGLALPELGDILVGTGELPIAGQVVSAELINGVVHVTLEIVPIDQMFTQLVINEVLDLGEVTPYIPEEIANHYTVTEEADGTLLFTPKSKSSASALAPELEFEFTPFTCKLEGTGTVPTFSLSNPVSAIRINRNFSLDLAYDSALGGFQKASVIGDLKAVFKAKPSLAANLNAKVSCDVELGSIPLPITGSLSWLLGFSVPLGVGFEVGGQLELAQLGVDIDVNAHYTAEFGVECPLGNSCTSIHELTNDNSTFKTDWVLPSGDIENNLRLKPEISGFGSAKLAVGIGNRYIGRIIGTSVATQFELIEAKGGLKQGADLAMIPAQVENTAYSSEYKLSIFSSIGAGSDINSWLSYFGMTGSVFEYQFPEILLASSPKVLSATANQDQYSYGDAVTFKVKLDQATVNYGFLGYNVDEISIYKRVPNAEGSYDYIHFFDMHATDEQTKFEREWVFTDEGNITDNYYAFVKTKFLPTFGEFGILEVAKIDPMEDYTVTSVCTTDGAAPQTVSSTYVDGRLSIQGSTQYTYNDITPEHYIVTATSSSGTVTTQEVNTSLPVIKPIRSRYLYNAPLQSYFYHLDHHPVPHYLLSDFYGNFYEYTNGRVTERRPNGDVFIRNYDSNYNVTSYIENRNNGTQRTTTYTYDSNGFISGCVDGNYNTTATTNYNNEDGKVNSLTQRTVHSDSGGFDYAETYTGNYNYDSHGNLTSEYIYYQEDESGDNDYTGSHTIAYTYDNLDNITHIMHNYYGDYEVFGEYTYGYTVEETYSFEANTKHLMHSDKTTTRPANIPGYPDAREVVTETSCDYTDTRW